MEQSHLDPDATPERFATLVVNTVGVDRVDGILVKVGDDRGRIRSVQNIPNLSAAVAATKGYRGQIADQLSWSEVARDAANPPAQVWKDMLDRIDGFLKEAENPKLTRSEMLEYLAPYPTIAQAIAYILDNGTPASLSLFDAVKHLDSLKAEQAARQALVIQEQNQLAKQAAKVKAAAAERDRIRRNLGAIGLTPENLGLDVNGSAG